MMQGSGVVAGCLSLGCVALGKFPGLSERWTSPSSRPSFSLPTFSYIGDCEISVELQRIQAGVSGIQVRGTWRHCPPHPSCPWGGRLGRGKPALTEQAAEKVRTSQTG